MLRLIACNVFQREACWCIARSPQVIDPVFLEVGQHVNADKLRAAIQEEIDRTEESAKPYEAVVLLYGLCGNAGVGLKARSRPLVLPRAHDCCTVLLGSRARFREHFGETPSREFSSVGYMERGDYFLRVEDGETKLHYGDSYAEMVREFGPEDAKYIWETMHPEPLRGEPYAAAFIDLPETAHLGYVDKFAQRAAAADLAWERLEGSMELIRRLLDGEWNEEEFLIVPPGGTTLGVYDWTEVLRAIDPASPASGGGES